MLRSLRWPLAIVLINLASLACAQVKLELKYPAEPSGKVKSTLKLNQTLTVMGMPFASGVDYTTTAKVEVGAPSATGEVPVKITTEAITASYTLPGGINLRFDSANPAAKADNPALEVILDSLRASQNAALTYRIADRKVVAVEGMAEIIRQAPQAAADLLKGTLDEARLKAEYQQGIDMFPTEAVKAGESWFRTEVWNLDGGQSLTFDRRYEYAGTVEKDGEQLDQINVFDEKVRYAIAGNAMGLALKASDLKIEASKGVILFDREAGAAVSNQAETHIKGTMTLVANNMDLPSELDMTISRSAESAK